MYSISLNLLLATLLSITTFQSVHSNDDGKSTGTSLIKNAIITRTDISQLASITESIRRMYQECERENYRTAHTMYTSTHSSKYFLKEIATKDDFQNTGLFYAFQMYGLTAGRFDQFSDTTPFTNFADVYIETQFNSTIKENDSTYYDDAASKCKKAATASVWQVLFLQAQHELWDGMKDCQISGDPNYSNEAAGIPDHNAKADEFIAYWVGSLNDSLETKTKYSLFSSTNEIGKYFGTMEHQVASVNKKIIEGYESLSALLSHDDSCDEYRAPRTLKAMWKINNMITPQMMVPLIQHLIRSMLVEEDNDLIEVYAKMVVPQIAQCRHSTYSYLQATLLDSTFDKKKIHDIMKALQDSYGCLGITCEDVGVPSDFKTDSLLSCKDSDYSRPILAGYIATSDVREEAMIDLDLHQMNLLMSFDNDHYWSLAQHIYMSGKNSIMDSSNSDDDSYDTIEYRSIHSMATSSLRRGTMFNEVMEAYNNDDPFYADGLIKDILNGDKYSSETRYVRASVIYNTILTHVLYPYVLGEMQVAIVKCVDGSFDKFITGDRRSNTEANLAWDQVAAFLIGSLEGSSAGGSDDFSDGVFLWSLANKRGIEFSRLNSDGFAIVNEQLHSYLVSGKGRIRHSSCGDLSRITTNIAHMLLIPMVQTMIKYAISNQFIDWKSGDTDVEVFEGEIYAKFMIPVYQKFKEIDDALTIQKNMIRNLGPLVADGPQVVADTFLPLADDIGIQCEFIGKSFEVDGCQNYEPSYKGTTSDGNRRIVYGATFMVTLAAMLTF